MGARNEGEAEIHARFAANRIGRTGQFRPGPDLMVPIGRPLLVSANPDAVAQQPVRRLTALTMEGTPEWKEWLEGFSKYLRTPLSTIVDHALVRYAKETGYEEEAPER